MLKKNKLTVFLILIIVVTGFIFSNSIKNSEESHASSGVIVQLVEPVFENTMEPDTVSFIVRKCAHIAEFFALGFLVLSATSEMKKKHMQFIGFGFFYVLLVAVTDEYIQSFSDRTSSVSDVLIDFAGAMLGFCGCILLNSLIKAINQRLLNKEKKVENNGRGN